MMKHLYFSFRYQGNFQLYYVLLFHKEPLLKSLNDKFYKTKFQTIFDKNLKTLSIKPDRKLFSLAYEIIRLSNSSSLAC